MTTSILEKKKFSVTHEGDRVPSLPPKISGFQHTNGEVSISNSPDVPATECFPACSESVVVKAPYDDALTLSNAKFYHSAFYSGLKFFGSDGCNMWSGQNS